ncbi:MAG: ferritin-like domain-containing protein [Hyphomicrobiaceae bacterium]
MALFSSDIKNLDDLFVHTLKDMYYAENRISKSLPNMISKASDEKLRNGFEKHLDETRSHVERLDRVFGLIDQAPEGLDCPAIDGIIDEAEQVASEVGDNNVLDAALIASAQAVEHYEITRYGSLVSWAKQLGHEEVANLLHQTLEEERATDEKLTQLAKSSINRSAQ